MGYMRFLSVLIFIAVLTIVTYKLSVTKTTQETRTRLFPFGEEVKDFELNQGDDVVHASICLSENKYRLYGRNRICSYVNNNGIISFGGPFHEYTIKSWSEFSLSRWEKDLLAVFWTDLDTRANFGSGTVYYRNTTNQSLLDEADRRIHQAFESQKHFKSKELVIATWDHVQSYGHTRQVNTFQAVLAVGKDQMFAIYLYHDLMKSTAIPDNAIAKWIKLFVAYVLDMYSNTNSFPDKSIYKALVGYTTADRKHSHTVNSSLTDDIVDVTTKSNVGVPGQWIFRLSNDILAERDPNIEDVVYYTKVPQEVIAADSGEVVVGQEEDIGVTVTVKEGAVPEGENLTLTLKACIHAEADPPKLAPVGKKTIVYNKASSFYVVEKNNVKLQEDIVVSIYHSIVVKNTEDYKLFKFHLHKKTSSGLKFVSEKEGKFIVDGNGERVGIVHLGDNDISVSVFVRIVKEMETPATATTDLPEQVEYMYNARFYKSQPYSETVIAVFAVARNEKHIRKYMHRNLMNRYSNYGVKDDENCIAQRTVLFANGSDGVDLVLNQSALTGYNVVASTEPTKITITEIEAFNYTDELDDDIDFPARIQYNFEQDSKKGQPGGKVALQTSGFETPLIFYYKILSQANIIQCPALSALANGMISYAMDNTPPYDIGTVATHSCNAGFSLVGNTQRTCMDDDQADDTKGVWSSTAPTCKQIRCPALPLANGMISYAVDNIAPYDIGTVATHSCNAGFALVGNTQRTCMDDDQADTVGIWSGNAPTCKQIQCPALPALVNGKISYAVDNTAPYDIGTVATHSCDSGLTLVRKLNAQRTCMDDDQADTEGVWSGTAPTCKRIRCQPLPALTNGMISYAVDNIAPYDIGTVATHSCDGGFALVGPTQRTCMDDDQPDTEGVWSGSAPTCKFDWYGVWESFLRNFNLFFSSAIAILLLAVLGRQMIKETLSVKKISISELVTEAGISEADLDITVDKYLPKIVHMMDSWLPYAHQLGLSSQQINAIYYKHGYEHGDKIQETLRLWKSNTTRPTFKRLLKTLLEYGHNDLAMKICELVKSIIRGYN